MSQQSVLARGTSFRGVETTSYGSLHLRQNDREACPEIDVEEGEYRGEWVWEVSLSSVILCWGSSEINLWDCARISRQKENFCRLSGYLYHGPEHLEGRVLSRGDCSRPAERKPVDLWKHHGEILEAAGRSACTRMEGRLLQLQAAQERCETNQTRTLAPERFHHPCRLCRFQYSN